jgi:hypothetical protein
LSSLAHGVDGGLVGGLLVAASAQPRRSHGGPLGHAHQFEVRIRSRPATTLFAIILGPEVDEFGAPKPGRLLLSNPHDNGKTCCPLYRKRNNINRLKGNCGLTAWPGAQLRP